MAQAFNWQGHDVVLQEQRPVAVYRTTWGGIAIRQRKVEVGGYDEEMELTPLGALQLGWRLIETAHWVGLPRPPRELMGAVDLGPAAPLADAREDGEPLPSSEREAA
jgi:hypothetical protein